METVSRIAHSSRVAEARAKIALAWFEQEPTNSNRERLIRAVADWDRALRALNTRAVAKEMLH
jgi:hypothetical protein